MRNRLRERLRRLLTSVLRLLTPPPDLRSQNRYLQSRLDEETLMREALQRAQFADAEDRISELIEARRMAGAGPWRVNQTVALETGRLVAAAIESLKSPNAAAHFHQVNLQESTPVSAQGAYGDIELALQNVEWRREINLSWLEFSRWGIQQIILICRLHFLKNPIMQRGVNVSAQYVFGRGVEVSSPDPDANDVLVEFFERNNKTLGQVALTELERATYYDGNLFFVFFTETNETGQVTVRTLDATEIMDVITDPEDVSTPWYYKREWTERNFNPLNMETRTQQKTAYYPALGFTPKEGQKPDKIGGADVLWDYPIYHRKVGAVSKWHFGCPIMYAALDWARASKQFLEACATVKKALAQISMTLTTKGGQAALENAKAQLSTQVGPSGPLWDPNPTPVNASIFGSGPGTTLQAFKTSGAGGDPEEVRRFELMVWRVFGLPETFGGDVSTGNLATATSLDRPTELNFLEKQERWREDLTVIAKYVLQSSLGAASGTLRESRNARKVEPGKVVVMEARRVSKKGQTVRYEAAQASDDKIEVMVTFPTIREGDMPALVTATVEAMTLGNSQGQVVGIDERAGVRKLYEICDVDNGDELIDEQYPLAGATDVKYDPNRTKDLNAPPPDPAAAPQPGAPGVPATKRKATAQEAMRRLREATDKLSRLAG